MDYAIQNTAEYGESSAEFPAKKLTWHMKNTAVQRTRARSALGIKPPDADLPINDGQ